MAPSVLCEQVEVCLVGFDQQDSPEEVQKRLGESLNANVLLDRRVGIDKSRRPVLKIYVDTEELATECCQLLQRHDSRRSDTLALFKRTYFPNYIDAYKSPTPDKVNPELICLRCMYVPFPFDCISH